MTTKTSKKAGELSPVMLNLIDTIINIMESKRITPRMLSVDTGIDEGYISRLMNKKRGMTIERLYQILDYLEYDLFILPKKEKEVESVKAVAIDKNLVDKEKLHNTETLFVKNHLQFRERTRTGMVFRRIWHYQDPTPLDRMIVDVQANGLWVEEDISPQPLWVDFMTAKDWAFKDGKIYMIFNHIEDKKRQSKLLNANDYSRYCERFTKYIKELDQSKEPKINGYKILGVYEIVF